MFFSELFLAVSTFLVGVRAASLSTNLVPLDTVGAVAAIQIPSNPTRIFYQSFSGGIHQLCIDGTFTTGGLTCGPDNAPSVPPDEVAYGSPIVAVTFDALPSNSSRFSEFRIYYFSNENILSEFIFTPGNPRHGDACPECITHRGFAVVPGSFLYAMANPTKPGNRVRVGFRSAGSPTTITEAVLNGNTNTWSLTVLPDPPA
ncbi:hypothetical protein VKT23_008718 [Stygiomarasmius scandens]|uniref:Uncharacterized protein n=1 Tax=Marasmiellus scandens TaxID=2682957 RepID=A0ABR1JGG3_9AGAR